MKIIGDDGNETPLGEAGEICIRGATVMQGYYNRPEDTAKVMKDGWMHTGDVGYLDEESYLYIVDRKTDMIISGGENISSIEVEKALYTHQSVALAAVVAMPDHKWGEVPCAFIELVDGASVTEDTLIEHCRARLAGFMRPKKIIFTELPKTTTGKILKTELRDRAKNI